MIEIELKVAKAKSRPQDYRPGQKAELRVSDGDTKHVSFLLIYFLHVSCLKTTFYLSTAQIKQKLRKMPNTATKGQKHPRLPPEPQDVFVQVYLETTGKL